MIARLIDARRHSDDDGGFALIFVLLVTTIVMLGVATALAAVTPNITAARRSQDALAAVAAARSGVDDLIAYLTSIPSCRSETRVCPAALNASSTALTGTARQRPTLGTSQSFMWRTNPAVTSDGYVRVTSTGTSNGVSRTLVADLSLQPSILSYGYYTDYEAQSPAFLRRVNAARNVYISDSSVYSNVSSSYRGSTSVPRYANWNGAQNTGNCGQHWYYESTTSPGRSSNGSEWSETGTLGSSTTSGTATSKSDDCDLSFSPTMVQDGKVFTRDAILSSGAGPVFKQPVFTMWGYDDHDSQRYTNPTPTAGQYYRGPQMTNTLKLPAVAPADLVLPKTIGTDGLPENGCVYTGPTRVLLNGDGTATITSPATKSKNPASDSGCYPTGAISSTGVIGWRVTYGTTGSGAIVVRNLGTVPTSGWPTVPTKATQTPAAGNEVFYLASGSGVDVARHTDTSNADSSGCSGSANYSAAIGATCAWTNLASAADGGTAAGWSTYTAARCNTSLATSNRELFECEYGPQAATSTPAVSLTGGQYRTVRTAIQNDIAADTCLTGSITAQAGCINDLVTARLAPANSPSLVTGAHRYLATTVAGTSAASTLSAATATSPADVPGLFTSPETVTRTPITTNVTRQTYNANTKTWSGNADAFAFTTTQTDYAVGTGPVYFPNPLDVTGYNSGTTAGGSPNGSSGVNQPGDIYVEGRNKGKLSVVADHDIVVTGDITNPTGYTADTDAVSLAAGRDVRNYNPVMCVDQNTTDIKNTSSGWCPNDITGLSSSSLINSGGYMAAHPARQYVNLTAPGDRTIEAAVFALSGSLRTDNFDRGTFRGDLDIHGGVYQSSRGGNYVFLGTTGLSGATLQPTYVDLQRAELPYVPPASSGNYSRPWDVVSISAGPS